MKFKLGQVVTTRAVADSGAQDTDFSVFVGNCIARHSGGDWGELDAEDKATNDAALARGGRLFSAYKYQDTKVWVITEADRSATTVLFPSDY